MQENQAEFGGIGGRGEIVCKVENIMVFLLEYVQGKLARVNRWGIARANFISKGANIV